MCPPEEPSIPGSSCSTPSEPPFSKSYSLRELLINLELLLSQLETLQTQLQAERSMSFSEIDLELVLSNSKRDRFSRRA